MPRFLFRFSPGRLLQSSAVFLSSLCSPLYLSLGFSLSLGFPLALSFYFSLYLSLFLPNSGPVDTGDPQWFKITFARLNVNEMRYICAVWLPQTFQLLLPRIDNLARHTETKRQCIPSCLSCSGVCSILPFSVVMLHDHHIKCFILSVMHGTDDIFHCSIIHSHSPFLSLYLSQSTISSSSSNCSIPEPLLPTWAFLLGIPYPKGAWNMKMAFVAPPKRVPSTQPLRRPKHMTQMHIHVLQCRHK